MRTRVELRPRRLLDETVRLTPKSQASIRRVRSMRWRSMS